MFDTDGSGAISASEFRDVCLAVGMTPTDDELKVHRDIRVRSLGPQGLTTGEVALRGSVF